MQPTPFLGPNRENPEIPPTSRGRGVGPQFHLSSLPHKRETGTINGDLQGSPPLPQFHFCGGGDTLRHKPISGPLPAELGGTLG